MTRVAVLFGGRSPEHWISFKSGLYVVLFLDRSLFEVEAIYVRQDGVFAASCEFLETVDRFFEKNAVVLARPEDGLGDWRALIAQAAVPREENFFEALQNKTWDVLFPAFHGRFGEDGTFQSLAEIRGIPYAGADFRASALGMDKILTKRLAAHQGLAVAPYREVYREDWDAGADRVRDELAGALGWPMFVKPARLGSSIGVGRARTPGELDRALHEAFTYDRRVLVESEIRGTEYAVGVLGTGFDCQTSVIAEYTSHPETFDYDSKYGPQSLEDIIPAKLSAADTQRMLEFARSVFAAVGVSGISRVDSFWGPDGPILNEINTLPGLNPNSPFIRAWAQAGVPPRELLTRIVSLALKTPPTNSKLSHGL